jgi:hypothetical protein
MLQPNADVTPAIPPHQSIMNYEDEEELNSWIWKSRRLIMQLNLPSK